MTCFTSYRLYDPLTDPWNVMCMYFYCSDNSSSSKLQETSLLFIMYDQEWFFVCRLYNMNGYKIQQAEFSYWMYADTVNTASEEQRTHTKTEDPGDYHPWRRRLAGERLWCVYSVNHSYNRVVHATGVEITGTEKLYVDPNCCNHGSDCVLIGFVRGFIVCM
jgi:hypothetical protein